MNHGRSEGFLGGGLHPVAGRYEEAGLGPVRDFDRQWQGGGFGEHCFAITGGEGGNRAGEGGEQSEIDQWDAYFDAVVL